MSLQTQIYLHSCDTSCFYDDQERMVHNRLVRLYSLRKRWKDKKYPDWRIKSVNRVLKKEKARLSELLDDAVKRGVTRELRADSISDKNVVNLFESDLTRSLGLEPFKLTDDLFIINVFFFQVFNNLVHNGFIYNGEKYIFLTASAGQIRTKKAVFIKQSSFKRVEKKLMCGLTVDEINRRNGLNSN